MKKIKFIYIMFILMNYISFGQTKIVDRDGGFIPQIVDRGTYIKDINNTFNKILGTWKWQDGNKVFRVTYLNTTICFHP
jgi:hypothetical protein